MQTGESIAYAVAQLGARRGYAIPAMLQERGLLEKLYTDLCANLWWLEGLGKVVPGGIQPFALKKLLGRRVEGVPRSQIQCFPWMGLQRILQRDDAESSADRIRHYIRANRTFCEGVIRKGLGDATGLYVFNGAGLELMHYARSRGMRVVVDQTSAPMAFEESLMREERERWPGWESARMDETDWFPMDERERAEWELADLILCGSEYVRDSIEASGGPTRRCVVVPYGKQSGDFKPALSKTHTGPLRVAYIGTVQLRKGIQYLMQAARLLAGADIEYRVIGPVSVSEDALRRIEEVLPLEGPVPRSAVYDIYDWADVLVLPTLSEGSAGVVYEALASGVPVITTPNAGSVVEDGVQGYLVPIRDAEALADRMVRLADDRLRLDAMRTRAQQRAAQFTWRHYGERLAAALTTHPVAA